MKTWLTIFFGGIALLFVFFVGMALVFGQSNAGAHGERIREIRVDGVIHDATSLIKKMDAARSDSSIRGVLLRIESPGGAVGASQELYQAIRELDAVKPVYASIGNIGASGGYYAALGARKIWANPGAITGSIGVITEFSDFHLLMEKVGVQQNVIKSGENKDAGSPYRSLSEKERNLFQGMIDDVYAQFRAVVATRRKIDSAALDTLADGRVFSGQQAYRHKLVDSLGSGRQALLALQKKVGLPSDSELERDEPEVPLLRRLIDPESKSLADIFAQKKQRVEMRLP